ncbi:MAG TPA: MnmC family methyltransferase [Candidatus Acidoferrum sp.]|nr:MnmC family methyltransferase [Candidatus Acidoferrum sp.]
MNDDYQLVQLANGTFTVRSLTHSETFHPVAGPMAEAEALYVHQLNLRERIGQRAEEFVIWDIGLGAGANALTALRCTSDLAKPIHVISFDRTTAALEFALKHAEKLRYVCGFENHLRTLIDHGHVEIQNGSAQVRWQSVIDDFPTTLACARPGLASPHAIFFDAYSPTRNPDMWTLPVLQNLHAMIDPLRPCSLATYSRSTMARAALLLAGFFVGVGEAIAEKEETTIAANCRDLIPRLLDAKWLDRARRSHGAEPLHNGTYVQRPLAPETWRKLCDHSQFK